MINFVEIYQPKYSQYHVLVESQTLPSGTLKQAQNKAKIDVTGAMLEFELQNDMDLLKKGKDRDNHGY